MSFVTIPKMPILEVGMEWPTATGPATVTFADLEAIVASQEDSEVKGARLKIGHWDIPDGLMFATEPSLGTFTNYSIVNNGVTLEADLVGVPEWFAEIMPTCFPNRSIEGYQQFRTERGKTYAMVLTAVSLLGVESPAITSLPDLAEFMNAETPPVQITAGGGMPQPVAARTNVEDVRREFYDQVAQGDQYWWWIRAVELDPENQLIVDDDDGKLYRMPFTTGTDGIVFSDPIPVAVEYNDIAASKVMANAAVTFAKADSTRPVDRVKATNTREDSVANTDLDATGVTASTAEEEEGTTPSAPEEPAPDAPDEGDGDDEDTQEDEEAVEEPSARILAGKLPKGVVVLDEQSYNQLKAGAAAGAEVKAKMDKQDKDALINGAIKAGKFPPARKAHYSAMYDADPVGTRDLIENVLQEGTIPMQARGTVGQDNGDPSSTAQFSGGAAYDPSWLSETERRHISAAKGA